MRGVAGLALGILALAASGCGSVAASQEVGSAGAGEQLFKDQCGSCHTLAAAGTVGTIGPDLDEALDDVRAQGFAESTIRDVVRGQIAYPVTDPPTDAPGMPANLVTGADAAAVAAYVASVAGKPVEAADEAEPGETAEAAPRDLFVENCASCHILADAGTTGTIGPSLDESQPSLEEAVEQITNGGGGMPAFEEQLSEAQIRAIAQYVVQASGG